MDNAYLDLVVQWLKETLVTHLTKAPTFAHMLLRSLEHFLEVNARVTTCSLMDNNTDDLLIRLEFDSTIEKLENIFFL